MAEFTEVMRQAQRMCHNAPDGGRRECPLWDEDMGCDLAMDHTPSRELDSIEQIVMAWAAQNTEQDCINPKECIR